MTAFYNEIDPKAAAWMRELIKQGHIAPGVVDERSIEDIRPDELIQYTQCHFFAGIGIWSHALRQSGVSDEIPLWTGSCPCQPFSAAGKGSGFADERHLWPAFHWLIQQCRPDLVFGEQVASCDGLAWLDLVSSDLEATGYTCGAVVFPACGVGAPHIRQRLYWVAHSEREGFSGRIFERTEQETIKLAPRGSQAAGNSNWWERNSEPELSLIFDGSPENLAGSAGFGNGIVAPQAQAFIETYLELTQPGTPVGAE